MKTLEFMKYVEKIWHILPDCVDISGNHIALKVNSGPDRSNKKFLAWCRACGIIVYPGVPNTTAFSQEMDQSYGGLKTDFYASRDLPVEHHLNTVNGSGHPQMEVADYGMPIFVRKEGTFKLLHIFEQYLSIKT